MRLPATASRISASIARSSAPDRSGVRRSVSSSANRQVRSAPSAVMRIRSHEEQKGCETGLMNPTSPAPSANAQRSAVDEAGAGRRTSGCAASIIARISSPVRTSSFDQVRSASSGMNSMKRTTYGLRRASSAKATTSCSVKPRIATQLTLIGLSSG